MSAARRTHGQMQLYPRRYRSECQLATVGHHRLGSECLRLDPVRSGLWRGTGRAYCSGKLLCKNIGLMC